MTLEEKQPSELYQELVENNGDEVRIHTQECVLWKVEHENCFGCPYELGCGKTVRLMLAGMQPTIYQPTTYNDFAEMQNRIAKLQDKTLKAKSVGELRAIPDF